MAKRIQAASIGFRVKTGRAIAVVVAGPAASPRVVKRCDVELCDFRNRWTRQPYHAPLELPEEQAASIVREATATVRSLGTRAVRRLAAELAAEGYRVKSIGLVVGSDIDPAKLGNLHVRAHALEGRLYRGALERGAAACRLPCFALVERSAYQHAATALGKPPAHLKRTVTALGGALKPWRAEEKTATLAAWLGLARQARNAAR